MNGMHQKQDVLFRFGMTHPLVLETPERLGGDTSAWLSHVPFAFWLTLTLKPNLFVELGTHTGVSYSAFCQAVRANRLPTRAFAVDTWQGDEHTGHYGEGVFNDLNLYNDRKYSDFSHLLRLTFDEAVDTFQDKTIDLLHIDGLHTYESARHDFYTWRPKLTNDAIVLFHDTQVLDRGFGVWQLFAELRQQYPTFEFRHGHGLGVLAMGNRAPAPLEGLLLPPGHTLDRQSDLAIQSFFETAGARLVQQGLREARQQSLPGETKSKPKAVRPTLRAISEGCERESLMPLAAKHGAQPDSIDSLIEDGAHGGYQGRSHPSPQSGLCREIQSLKAQLETERSHTSRTAEMAAGTIACARRGIRGAIGTLLRRFGSSPLIDQCAVITGSGLFDRQAYIEKYRNDMLANVEPVADYVLVGAYAGRDPNPLFDSQYYLRANGDVAVQGINPLFHYITVGEGEGRRPNPLFDPVAYRIANPGLKSGPLALADYLEQVLCRHPRTSRNPLTRFWRRWIASAVHRETRATLQTGRRGVSGKLNPAGKVAFQPASPLPADKPADKSGIYIWSNQAQYAYVPPARPSDLEDRLADLELKPLFSIVVPLYNTTPDLLSRLVASVQAQWYAAWELVLVDDASPKADVREALAKLDDSRIVKVMLSANRGISGATNVGIEAAKGDYVVFLDHDDELTADCLYELALCASREGADFIYSDEDKITPDGRFAEPFFKPDWSPDTLMSLMYTCHVSCVRKSLLLEAGLLRSEYDGSQDWDLVLRITELTSRISHIPKVLYHWRIVPGSTSGTYDAKPAALEAAKALRLEAMRRRNTPGIIEELGPGSPYARVQYAVSGSPLISIVIPSKDNPSVLRKCLESIFAKTQYGRYEVVLVDNGSTDPAALAYLSSLSNEPRVHVAPHDKPFNFSELCNVGARAASGDILLFLNDDTEVLTEDWLERLAGYAQLSHVGAVGAKLLYPNSLRIQHAGVINIAAGPNHAFIAQKREAPGYFARTVLAYNWIAVTGACLMIERGKFERAGGFDESFPVAYNDIDLCYRLLDHGLYNVLCPDVELIHYESLSRGADHLTEEKRARLKRDKQHLDITHPKYYLIDPFYNENLHPNDLYFSTQV